MAQLTALPDPVSEGKVINVMHLHLRGILRTAMDERSRLPGGSGEHQLVQELLHQRRHHVLHARQRRRASHDVAKYKLPYEDKETEEEVPNKYNIILDMPRDDEGNIAPSGF